MKKIIILAALVLLSCNQKKNSDTVLNNSDTIEVQNSSDSEVLVDAENTTRINPDLLIIPGKSIGVTNLLDDSATLEKFGKPTYSDAAMGKAWLLWQGSGIDALGKKATLAVYVTYNGSDMSKQVVKRIRITSPDFKTAEGAHTRMSFKDVENIYPNLEIDSKISNSASAKGTKFFLLKGAGISFEFENIDNTEICTAIAIASTREISNQPYLMKDSAEIQR